VESITPHQFYALLVVAILELGTIRIPRALAEAAGADAWLSAIAVFVFLTPVVLINLVLARRFPDEYFPSYSKRILGSFLGGALSFLYAGYWAVWMSLVLIEFGHIVRVVLLEKTPSELVVLYMLLVGLYLARQGLGPIARSAEILLLVVILVVVFSLTLTVAAGGLEFTSFLPFLADGPLPPLKAGLRAVGEVQGVALLLVLYPFLRRKAQALRATVAAMWGTVAVIVVGLAVVTQAALGVSELINTVWPVLSLERVVKIPFLERLDIVFLMFWATAVFTTVVIALYGSAHMLAGALGFKTHQVLLFPLLVVTFLMSSAEIPQATLEVLGQAFGFVTLAFTVFFPGLLLLVAALRGVGGVRG